jgi:hypothetical protein
METEELSCSQDSATNRYHKTQEHSPLFLILLNLFIIIISVILPSVPRFSKYCPSFSGFNQNIELYIIYSIRDTFVFYLVFVEFIILVTFGKAILVTCHGSL